MKSSSLQFQIEKRTRSVFQLDEVYNSCCFKPDLRKNPVAKTSKELVCFFCRSARFAVLQFLFSGSVEVAAGLSNWVATGLASMGDAPKRGGLPKGGFVVPETLVIGALMQT